MTTKKNSYRGMICESQVFANITSGFQKVCESCDKARLDEAKSAYKKYSKGKSGDKYLQLADQCETRDEFKRALKRRFGKDMTDVWFTEDGMEPTFDDCWMISSETRDENDPDVRKAICEGFQKSLTTGKCSGVGDEYLQLADDCSDINEFSRRLRREYGKRLGDIWYDDGTNEYTFEDCFGVSDNSHGSTLRRAASYTRPIIRPKWLGEDDQTSGQTTDANGQKTTDGQTQNPADQTADAGGQTADANANTETPAPTVVNGSEGETTVTEGKKVFKSLFKTTVNETSEHWNEFCDKFATEHSHIDVNALVPYFSRNLKVSEDEVRNAITDNYGVKWNNVIELIDNLPSFISQRCADGKCEKKGKLSDLVNESKRKRKGKTFGYAPIVAPLAPEGGGGEGGCCIGESCKPGDKNCHLIRIHYVKDGNWRSVKEVYATDRKDAISQFNNDNRCKGARITKVDDFGVMKDFETHGFNESCCGGRKVIKRGRKILKESYDPSDYDEVYVGRNDEFYNEDPDDESVFQKTLWTWGETSDDSDFAKEGPVFRLTDDGKMDFLEWLDAEQVGGDLCYGRMKDYPKKHLSSEQEWEYLTDPANGLSEKVEISGNVDEADDGTGDDAKKAALAKHFDVKPEEVTYNGYTYEVDGQEWKVYTEEEAEKAARDYIREALWAFNADFILNHCATCKDMSDNEREETKKALSELTGKLCESGNGIVLALIGGEAGLEEFCEDAISADGRANFLSNYDGNEVELDDGFLAYKM